MRGAPRLVHRPNDPVSEGSGTATRRGFVDCSTQHVVDRGRPGRAGVLSGVRGRPLAEHDVPVRDQSAAAVFDAVGACFEALVESAGQPVERMLAITVGTPGVIDRRTGVLSRDGILPQLDGTNPGVEMRRRFGLDVDIDVDDVPFLAILAGLRPDTAGPRFDVSFEGVAELAALRASEHPETRLGPDIDALEVLAAADDDPLGAAVREELVRWIAWYVAMFAAVVAPEIVILVGPLLARDEFVDPVSAVVGALLAEPPRVVVSQLGHDAVLVGALARARRTALDLAFASRELPVRHV